MIDLTPHSAMATIAQRLYVLGEPHGLAHAQRVAFLAGLLAEQIGNVAMSFVVWTAWLHDCGRVDHGGDPEHGERGAQQVRAALIGKPLLIIPAVLDAVCEMIQQHCDETLGDIVAMRCVKDADKLDRFRLGEGALDEGRLALDVSREFIPLARRLNGLE